VRRAVLLGVSDTKRTKYLKRAAKRIGLPLSFAGWKDWRDKLKSFEPDGVVMKIDPPRWDSPLLGDLDDLAKDYRKQLKELADASDRYNMRFLNHPSEISALLDKAGCKETLRRAGIPVTELLAGNVRDVERLFEIMKQKNACQVFIKPVNGSGAAGVAAFRKQEGSGRMALYTCAAEHPKKGLVNTGRLRRFSDKREIFSLLNRLFEMECVVERWHAKAEHQGCSYDLRAVVQDGKCDCLLARLSKGPITNLQLNNHPLDVDGLGLSLDILEEILDISKRAMRQYPRLLSAGIDILLEKGSLKPRIIEMNGQGDLIYQDIYRKNAIYLHQAELIKKMGEELG